VDLIISDWNMPKCSGLDFLRWVRNSVNWKQTPFIMATAQSDKKQEHLAVTDGVSGLVAKPFSPDELEKKIANIEISLISFDAL